MTITLRSPLKRVGGKHASMHPILAAFPHPKMFKRYVEPCFGAGHVFFGLPRNGHEEIINDKEDNLMCFWMQMLDHADEMRERLSSLPYARGLYYIYYRSLFDGSEMPDIERAVRYFYVLRSTGTGWMRRSPVGWNHLQVNNDAYYSALELFRDIQERLRGVRIDNRDVLATIKRYDSFDTFSFIDPPYIGSEWYYEACRKDGFPHEELADLLNHVQGKVALSYYPHAQLEQWYPADRWNRVTWQQPKSSDIKSEEMQVATEMLLTNYETATAGHQQGSLWEAVG